MDYIINFFKHPIVLAIIVTILAFLYMYRENDKEHKKNPNVPMKSTGYGIPLCAGIITFIIATFYLKRSYPFSSTPTDVTTVAPVVQSTPIAQPAPVTQPVPVVQPTLIAQPVSVIQPPLGVKQIGGSNKILHFIGKNNIRLPQTDVFIDIAKL